MEKVILRRQAMPRAAPVAAVGGAGEAEFCDSAGREQTNDRKNAKRTYLENTHKTLPGEP